MGPVNLRAEVESAEIESQMTTLRTEREDLISAISRLRQGISNLNREGRERLLAAFNEVDSHFQQLFVRLVGGGRAHMKLSDAEDPLEAGLEIFASPPGKRLQVLSLLSGGEQARIRVLYNEIDPARRQLVPDFVRVLVGDINHELFLQSAASQQESLGEASGDIDVALRALALADQAACSERRLILVITSHMGSIADIGSPRSYAYRSSKAALNAAMKGIALELRPRGIGLLLLHPGWVSTRMGGDAAPYAPQQSVSGMRQLADHFRMEQSGRFYRFDGVELPW